MSTSARDSASTTAQQRRTAEPATRTKEATTLPSLVEKIEALVHWNDLPDWQRDNHYIHTGYVRETNSFKKTLHSLTYLHNETVNIYSHLVPSAAVLAVLSVSVVALVETAPFIEIVPETDWSDYTAATVFAVGVITCLGLSATFHTLKSHSHAVASFGNQLDYAGIVVLIVASMVSLDHYAFYDQHDLRAFFWALVGLLGTACAVVSLTPKFRTPEWRSTRAAMFVAFGLSGALPVLVSLYIYGSDQTWRRFGLGWLLAEAVQYVGGAAIYAARVPERFKPGGYDYFGHSHQIFHVLVVLAAICHGVALHKAYLHAHALI